MKFWLQNSESEWILVFNVISIEKYDAQKYDALLWNINREKHTGMSWWELSFSLRLHFWSVCNTKSYVFLCHIWCKVSQTHGSSVHNLKALLWERCNDNTWFEHCKCKKRIFDEKLCEAISKQNGHVIPPRRESQHDFGFLVALCTSNECKRI